MGELFFTEQRIKAYSIWWRQKTQNELNLIKLPSYLDLAKSPVYGNVPVSPGAASFIPFFNLQFRLWK